MFLERLQDLVRVELEVPHDLPEHVPFDLGERQTDVLVGQQRMIAPTRFIERAVDDAFGRLGHLVLRNIEILHGRLHGESCSGSPASRLATHERAKARPADEHRRDGANALKREESSDGSGRRGRRPPATCGRQARRHPLVDVPLLAHPTPPRSARMRASVGGWLLKSDIRPAPENGLTMNMCAVAGLASSGTRLDTASIFRSASASPYGLPAMPRRRRPRRTRATARSPSGSASRRAAPGSSSRAARSGCCRDRDRRGRRSRRRAPRSAPSAPPS